MKPSQDSFPVFEANQVLSYSHLNQIFNYLDEQERLTRADLIGIGIVCGLGIAFAQNVDGGASISLSRGVGVTSLGYLIVEPEDTVLTSYRQYELPTDLPYPPFMNGDAPYDLWELFPAGEPDTTPLASPDGFLSDKAVLLFLELKKEGLRNCSMNNCDDRGAEMTVTLRRLLVRIDDLKEIIAKANALEGDLSLADLEAALLERLNLPDLRLPRVDIPNTGPATSKEVLAAFHAVFHTEHLVQETAAALSAAYDAFKPLVAVSYPTNPFADFTARYGSLDNIPANTVQVRFLQYYYELFDDILRAYGDLCREGARLLFLCCPPDQLFPRHLMLGVLYPNLVSNAAIFRTPFWGSPILRGSGEEIALLEQLFARLVELTRRFTDSPPLAPSTGFSRLPVTDNAIRITPSALGDLPLSKKAIPYYYLFNGTPSLYQLWDPEKTARNRANLNLGYRSDSYQPAAPTFVLQALRYDLEPYNFLRVEGHLGKNYLGVMNTLLSYKSRYRLPIEVVALRTGAFDENIPVDLTGEECRFQDLETLYDTLKAEAICFFCEEVQYFYALPFEVRSKNTTPAKPQLPLLVQCAPDFMVQPHTIGRLFEDFLANQPGGKVPDIDPNIIINFLNSQNVGQSNLIIFYIILYISKLYEQFTQDLGQLDFAAFQKRYQDLLTVTDAVEREREDAAGSVEGTVNLLKWEELDDRLEAILYYCRLDAFKTLAEEYKRRVREVKQKQFLGDFLRRHPGIQHKGGVPLGGTFIIVYHHEPGPRIGPIRIGGELGNLAGRTRVTRPLTATTAAGEPCSEIDSTAVLDAFNRIGAKRDLLLDPDIRLVLGAFTGRVPDLDVALPPTTDASGIIDAAVKEIAEGAVIADFYLPYLCCSDCAPIQFVLPKPPPSFTIEVGCTNANNQAEVTLTPEGGLPPYSVKVDQQDFQPLNGVLALSAGSHTLSIRDQEAAESAPQTVQVAPRMVLKETDFTCEGTATYRSSFSIEGGTPPFLANDKPVTGNVFSTDPIASGTSFIVTVTDQNNCSATSEVRHDCQEPCTLPCNGQSRRCAYRLWIQPPAGDAQYKDYRQTPALKLRFNGRKIELSAENLPQIDAPHLNENFDNAIGGYVKALNDAINQALIDQTGALANRLVLSYQPEGYPFRALQIEYFVCDSFNLSFQYSFAKPDPAYSMVISYSNEPAPTGMPFDGALSTNKRLKKETRVPAFDCSERNQCTGGDYQKLCEGPVPQLDFSMKRGDGNVFHLHGKVGNMPENEMAAWVWDFPVESPNEPFYEGQNADAQLQHPAGTVVLTGITSKGCIGSVQKEMG
ncbi:hypothetical protein Gbem_2555 [Citrifermentans bemidjiense Bem]|uniref:Uncharacterized protein n=1 Tax=Citrifermentans bemidjiense (strain ATCC BAA-1014 / DSM 16622 / JCM 12645 / Bem) TaxID=404380 RepID=B5EGT0_CITBB|nr:hypothetical protein [Citrifermentans bemidjiense]ACH39563.1 hypothetical protein Gbem_2555 [Citrifermentans bemidjiense Bem]